MKSVKFSDLGMYETFLEEFGDSFQYLHVSYEGGNCWCVFLTETPFPEYWQHTKVNYYEIGIYETVQDLRELQELLGEQYYQRFYKIEY